MNFTLTKKTILQHTYICRDNNFTCFGVNREVWLAMEDAVYHSSTVSIGRVICICGCHLRHICPWGKEWEDILALTSFVSS